MKDRLEWWSTSWTRVESSWRSSTWSVSLSRALLCCCKSLESTTLSIPSSPASISPTSQALIFPLFPALFHLYLRPGIDPDDYFYWAWISLTVQERENWAFLLFFSTRVFKKPICPWPWFPFIMSLIFLQQVSSYIYIYCGEMIIGYKDLTIFRQI